MSIKQYRKKRSLAESREPIGKKRKKSFKGQLTFVVQKHAARRLHYDFRLELDGVLKSWAIPKGPSLDPGVKRLAVHVEDHPLEYGDFEGIIPAGNYGAGKVEIWDKGTYVPAEGNGNPEKLLKKELNEGKMKIILSGKKLKGEFALVRIKKEPEKNQWLLIKAKDAFATGEQVIKNEDPVPGKARLPHHVFPMLATVSNEPFDSPDWIYEVKWDGYRAIGEVDKTQVKLYSRNFKLFNEQFPNLVHELKKAHSRVVLDGEIVALDRKGRSSFQLLQNYLKTGKGNLRYYIFDLLFLDGRDLRDLPLLERKKQLKEFLQKWKHPSLFYCDHIEEKGELFLKEAKKLDLEGVIAKRKDSVYLSERTDAWLKFKIRNSQEAIIVGFTQPKGGRKKFGSLLLGANVGGKMAFIGHVGTGFDDKDLENIFRKMQPLITKECPLNITPKINTPAVWIKPKLVCEVAFREWTDDGRMRQPSFLGLREDKLPPDVQIEGKEPQKKKKEEMKNHKLTFLSNLEKIFWKKKGYTKGDLIEYYNSISPYILPHLKERPIVLHRFPDGAEGKEFYQKEAPNFTPSWMRTAAIEHPEKTIHYLMVSDVRSLLYVANLGCIELHPFLSRMQQIENPDFVVLDLDPESISFKKVVLVAETLHQILDELKISHYCKTSGKRGLHFYIPLGGKYSFDQSQNFAEILARIVHQELPKITSLIRNPQKRQKRVYIDYLQNSRTKTVVAPYSLRPTPDATVSTPLEWHELDSHLDPREWTIKTIGKRLSKKGDLFRPMLRQRINLKTVLPKMEKLLPSSSSL